ncbi:transducin beta-like protein 3 [Oppia nitens]|uniref:transducin beta-like protein 3 n=1 Tax=Oppia nitens TaxID=1686743 RepID=UPI0023D9BCD5|nr:transducin beta-like protein 3 [Oppia nitens]
MSKISLKQSFAVKSKIDSFFTSNKLQITGDGKYIFSTCLDVLKVIDVSTGHVIKEIKSETDDNIIAFGVSRSSHIVVIGHQSGLLRQWIWSEQRLERTWKSIHSAPIVDIICDPTDTLVATAGSDSTIKVWHLGRNYCTHNLRGAKGVISCVVFSPTHSEESYYIYGVGDDYSVHVWDLVTSKHVNQMDGHCSKVTAIKFSLDGQHILTASRDKLVIVWSASDHQMVRSIPIYESLESIEVIDGSKISVINLLVNNKIFVTAGERGVLRVWNYGSGDLLYTQQNSSLVIKEETEDNDVIINSRLITQTLYSEELLQLVVISSENNILFHKIDDFSVVKQFVGHMDEVLDIKILGITESHIAIATNSPNIKIFELSTLNCDLLKGHKDIVLCLETFKSDPNILLSSSKDNSIRIWKFSETFIDRHCIYYGSGHTHSVTSIATPYISNNFFVSGSEDTTLKVWKIPKKTSDLMPESPTSLTSKFTQKAHEKDVNTVAVSPNDQLIASGSQDKTAKIWSVDGLKLLGVMRGHRKGIWNLKFSPIDQILVTASADATIKIWALIDYSCLKTFEGHDCSVLKVLFIDRGMQLITSASDGNIKIWNIKDNECVKTLDAHNDKVWALALTQTLEETLMISGSSDSSIIIWRDVTEKETEELALQKESQVESEQNLLNCMQKKNWLKALKLAIRLDHPFRALNIIKEILIDNNGVNEINEIFINLREDQLLKLLDYSVVWNTNSKHYIVSQCVLKAIVEKISPKDLLKTHDLKQTIEKLLPYNEKHLNRLNRLQQSVTFVDYVWQQIKLPDLNDNKSLTIDNNEDIEDIDGSHYDVVAISDSDNESNN